MKIRNRKAKRRIKRARASRLVTRNPSSRRGILLLVILSLLTLFLMIGMAFIVSANQYRKMNKVRANITEQSNAPVRQQKLLDEAINQLVRDTNNASSVLRFHSLLRDLYGNDGLTAIVQTAGWAPNTGDQMLQFSLTNLTDQFGNSVALSNLNNAYSGLTLTFLDKEARNQSTRIVGYVASPTAAPNNPLFRVMSVHAANGANITTPSNLNGAKVVINGRPFNGTGVGYSLTPAGSARLDAMESIVYDGTPIYRPIALMPNSVFTDPRNIDPNDVLDNLTLTGPNQIDYWTNELNATQRDIITRLHYAGLGGSDESYDAVDYQNMALAMLPMNPVETAWPDKITLPLSPPPTLGNTILPSFHRPALINYWASQNALVTSAPVDFNPVMLRKVLLRPSWMDHPNFTGSNPEFASVLSRYQSDSTDSERQMALLGSMIYGPWDVDNDNDGIRDSVWVDIGAPVMKGPQGRLVKPMAAMLVLDMDGRLNLNAHGTGEMVDSSGGLPTPQNIAGGIQSNILPHGQGYGPAEISLAPVVGPASSSDIFSSLLTGVTTAENKFRISGDNYDRDWPGRYGIETSPNNAQPGLYNQYDLLAQLNSQGVPQWANQLGNYATQPDLHARYPVGLNDFGQPVYESFNLSSGTVVNDTVPLDLDSPYEINLSTTGARGLSTTSADSPFTSAEFERILRAYDVDASKLPNRIWQLAQNFKDNAESYTDIEDLNQWRTLLTTDSFDLPVPNVVVPQWMILGADAEPGEAGVDDDGANGTDDVGEIGWAGSDDYQALMNKAPIQASFADLLEYRIRLTYYLDSNTGAPTLPALTASILRSEMSKLLSPDLADGLRLDINRAIGNGRDDDNDGVVDEPGEEEDAFWQLRNSDGTVMNITDPSDPREAFTGDGGSSFGRFQVTFDRNGDGIIEPHERGDIDDNGTPGSNQRERLENSSFRRQILARHLYVLAMTLVDPIPIPTGGPTNADYIEKTHQRARALAQWAINVVDYRDPDNIMTAFEYDINPFDGWGFFDSVSMTYKLIDGDIASFDATTMQPEWAGPDNEVGTEDDYGGVVWGLERPELIMTETLSWHDRATEDRGKGFEDAVTDENGDGKMDEEDEGTVGSKASTGYDTDYDQRKRPQGATFIELYNPWQVNPAANADVHEKSTGADEGVDLAAFAISPNQGGGNRKSPVWRMQVNKCGSVFQFGGGPDRDHDDPNYLVRPRNPDRTVYFTGFDPEESFLDGSQSTWDDDGTAFYSSIVNPDDPDDLANHPIVRPGKFCVVGSGRFNGTDYLASIGDKSSGATSANAPPGVSGIALNPTAKTVELRDTDGIVLHDSDVNRVEGEPGETEIALIDSYTWRRYGVSFNNQNVDVQREKSISDERTVTGTARFSVSEPSMGYPDHCFNSVWNEVEQKYKPILDIPLDSQRLNKEPGFGGGNKGHVIDGQVIDSATDPRWFRGTNPNNLQEMFKDDEARLKVGEKGETVRTIPAFSWIYLQRLANPTMPWNPMPKRRDGTDHPAYDRNFPVNPYMTVDSMGTNVTVFTGQAIEEKRRQGADVEIYNNADAMYSFTSVQRGRRNNTDPEKLVARLGETQEDFRKITASSARNQGFLQDPHQAGGANPVADSPQNLWSEEQVGLLPKNATSSVGMVPNKLPIGLWLNKSGPNGDGLKNEAVTNRTHFFHSVPDCTLGFMNEPFRLGGGAKTRPGQPFPWLTWNNRPFANVGELLQVPKVYSSRLQKVFSFSKGATDIEKYTGQVESGNYPANQGFTQLYPEFVKDGPFGHLANFFRAEADKNGTENDLTDDEGIVGFYRILDYVHVPSRFVGTKQWLSPATFGNTTPSIDSPSDPRYLRQPPFNFVSSYREPGRVNINTIVSADVWDGGILHRSLPILDGINVPDGTSLPWDPYTNNYSEPSDGAGHFGHAGPLFIDVPTTQNPEIENGLVESRRGYQGASISNPTGNLAPDDSMLLLDSDTPTFFANPFRSAEAGDLVPLNSMRQQESVNCTLLRGVQAPPPAAAGVLEPLFASSSNNAYDNAERNPYFRYQPISRISSLTTTRSNVYAVWVTIGFFEVEEVPRWADLSAADQMRYDNSEALYNKVYPEGYQLGSEAGVETGDIQRIREFALIDRSVPVAFEPGKDHNVDKAIRLRRRIE